jgi:hypothetical protein
MDTKYNMYTKLFVQNKIVYFTNSFHLSNQITSNYIII